MNIFKKQEKPIEQPLLVDIRETARLLGVSQRTVWQLANDGCIKAVKIGKRGVRYTRHSIDAFAQNSETQGK